MPEPIVDIAASLSARERVALLCVATGIDYPTIGMMAGLMQTMRDRGLVVREGAPKRHILTEVGRDVFLLILEQSGFGPAL